MARLTILQASQQGFGSTLTIHRHIKEGSLPVYEEGDAKMLEVDDLITVLGEPAGGVLVEEQASAAVDQIDMYEYNRMKSDLDQKNKKNMWLAADLAEVVRELKEKEAKFEAERTRLLKVLEQAQTLLLREAKRAGGGGNKDDLSGPKHGEAAANGNPRNMAEERAPAMPENTPSDAPVDHASGNGNPLTAGMSHEEMTSPNGEDSGGTASLGATFPDAETTAETGLWLSSETSTDASYTPPSIIVEDETRPIKRSKSRKGVNPVNPLVPPFEESDDKPTKSRLMSTTNWLMLLGIVGGGLVVFEFRTQVVSSVENIMKALGG